jgi:predicted O-methyltransferase YrrM
VSIISKYNESKLIYEFDSNYSHYQIWDLIYDNRPARVLYTGQKQTAQSGVAMDDNPDLLFDYNQRLIELITGMKPLKILLIGGGTLTLPSAVNKIMPQIRIDVVEIDESLKHIATKYFGYKENINTKIIDSDGLSYLKKSNSSYDFIIIDAFTQAVTPLEFSSPQAAKLIKKHLTPNGLVLTNIISAFYGPRASVYRERLKYINKTFTYTLTMPASPSLSLWLPQNLLLIAHDLPNKVIKDYLRYQPLDSGEKGKFNIKNNFKHLLGK